MRALKIGTIVMGVLIVVGTMALIIAVARRPGGPPPFVGAGLPPVAVALEEPAGTRIAGVSAAPDRVAVQLQGGGVDRVVLIDSRSGAVVGRISLAR